MDLDVDVLPEDRVDGDFGFGLDGWDDVARLLEVWEGGDTVEMSEPCTDDGVSEELDDADMAG